MLPGLSPDQRADMVLQQMTLEEKIELMHGNGMPGVGQAASQRLPGQRWRRLRAGGGASGHSHDSDERRRLRCAQQRGERPLLNCVGRRTCAEIP